LTERRFRLAHGIPPLIDQTSGFANVSDVARPRITEERRRQILEAAGKVIAERGICDARIADIAAEIGSSPALILYYFPTKDSLLAEALSYQDQRFFDHIAGRLDGAETATERLEVVIEASIPPGGIASSDSEWQLWLEMWARSRHDPSLARERERLDADFRGLIADVVRAGVSEGVFLHGDPEAFSVMLSSLIDGLALQVLLGDSYVTPDVMRSICRDVANRALRSGVGSLERR